jgi:hypothetical protein
MLGVRKIVNGHYIKNLNSSIQNSNETIKNVNKGWLEIGILNKNVFASSTILVKISHVTWIFLPWVFKYIAQKMEFKESNDKYLTPKVLRSNEVIFHSF